MIGCGIRSTRQSTAKSTSSGLIRIDESVPEVIHTSYSILFLLRGITKVIIDKMGRIKVCIWINSAENILLRFSIRAVIVRIVILNIEQRIPR